MIAEPEARHLAVEVRVFEWRKHSRDVLDFQREVYETNFPGFVVTREFLRDYGVELRRAANRDADGVFVLEQDAIICGFLWVSLIATMVDPCIGYIRNIYVAPDLRAHGYGKKLLEVAQRWCLSRNVTRLALDASCCNEAAMALYASSGFEPVRYRMEKRLDPGLVAEHCYEPESENDG